MRRIQFYAYALVFYSTFATGKPNNLRTKDLQNSPTLNLIHQELSKQIKIKGFSDFLRTEAKTSAIPKELAQLANSIEKTAIHFTKHYQIKNKLEWSLDEVVEIIAASINLDKNLKKVRANLNSQLADYLTSYIVQAHPTSAAQNSETEKIRLFTWATITHTFRLHFGGDLELQKRYPFYHACKQNTSKIYGNIEKT